jgi:hypothetical protein
MGVAASASAVAACTGLKDPGDRPSGVSTSVTQGDPADGGAGQGDSATCKHREPPPRPTVLDAGGSLDLVFAVNDGTFGTGGQLDGEGGLAYESIGFDLDGKCTGEGEGTSCREPPGVPVANYTDGVEGIDNSVAAFTQVVNPTAFDLAPVTADGVDVVFRVRDYNGLADDDQVDLAVYAARSLDPRPPGDPHAGSSDLFWDGRDRWRVIPDTLAPNDGGALDVDRPRYHDGQAYVTHHVLVAHLPEVLWSSSPNVPTWLAHNQELVLAGTLEPTDGGDWGFDEIVTGQRVSIANLLAQVARAPYQSMPIPTCTVATVYREVKAVACANRDISVSMSTAGSSAACDALSGSSILHARAALLSQLLGPPVDPPPDCEDSGIDPDNDSCGDVDDPAAP